MLHPAPVASLQARATVCRGPRCSSTATAGTANSRHDTMTPGIHASTVPNAHQQPGQQRGADDDARAPSKGLRGAAQVRPGAVVRLRQHQDQHRVAQQGPWQEEEPTQRLGGRDRPGDGGRHPGGRDLQHQGDHREHERGAADEPECRVSTRPTGTRTRGLGPAASVRAGAAARAWRTSTVWPTWPRHIQYGTSMCHSPGPITRPCIPAGTELRSAAMNTSACVPTALETISSSMADAGGWPAEVADGTRKLSSAIVNPIAPPVRPVRPECLPRAGSRGARAMIRRLLDAGPV